MALLVVVVSTACSQDGGAPVYELTGPAMGTSYSIKLVDPVAETQRQEMASEVSRVLERIEDQMSTWRPDSEISTFNDAAVTDWFPVSDEMYFVVSAAQEVSRLTDGAFDVTVGPLVNMWGFGPAAMRDEPPDPDDIADVMEHTGFEHLELQEQPPALRKRHPDIYVDLSAIAKGYAVDRLAMLMDARNIENYLVEIGGELRARGRNARGEEWTVAIEKPLANQRSLQRLLYINDLAVATSGNYRNFFDHAGQRYSHTIDPRTGVPATHNLASVTVVGPSTMMADALATAFMVMGPEAGFDLAIRRGVAALFMVGTTHGFTERSTPSFLRLLEAEP